MGGYTGKILRINLTYQKSSTEPLNMGLARKYLSGRGLAGKMFTDEVASDVDALSPENKLFIATGMVTGTDVPTSGRFMAVTKSPLNGVISSSNFGGDWGAQLKFAGYDMVILEGKANHPVYITIENEQVKIKDAAPVWGKDAYVTTAVLKQEFGDDKGNVLTIGPAGENLSLMAVVINDLYRAAGRSGVGTVMGSKKVKAIMIRGTGRVEDKSPNEKRPREKEACCRCPITCGRYSKGNGGEGAKSKGKKSVGGFGSDLGINDDDAIREANDLCNKLGLDTISVGATLATGIELVRQGYMESKELNGTPLEFGNAKGMLEWVRKIAYAEGVGAKMALGSYRFAESYGAQGLAMTVKKIEIPVDDTRDIQRQALTAVIDAVGICLFTSFALSLSDYTAIVNAAIGSNYTDEELLACGERILNNERMYDLRVGYTAAE